ncbi:MAG: hypothetical protein ACYTHJ_17230 [Planctomycetota bacterium]|jgi:hypothetical protein
MLNNSTKFVRACFCLAVAAVGPVGFAQYEISRSTIDGGGAMASGGGGFELVGTIGQPDAGLHTGDGFALTGGFWFQLESGDCNQDGAVTHYDVAEFGGCLTGPDVTVSDAQCGCADFDSDDDVDLRDQTHNAVALTSTATTTSTCVTCLPSSDPQVRGSVQIRQFKNAGIAAHRSGESPEDSARSVRTELRILFSASNQQPVARPSRFDE